ncbi:MazG family protein [Gordonia caeni]|uniref:NTP pyrophosphohydrolase MazG-like domain-containing protein n=1 Tax=Gordonia caeni TaxID=1007097 RepID=A0ABP7PFM9_9ACTN
MPVILLDPALPDMIPVRAMSSMTGHVFVTEDVHPTLLWNLPSYQFASDVGELPFGALLLSSDRDHPLVRRQIARGDQVFSGDAVPGTRLLEAVALMDKLRRTGPWEGQQTHDSLRRYLLEEVYELLDAFDTGTSEELCSELGDLLLQVLFHARIAEDSAEGSFSIDDVAQSFVDKVSYRTPGILAGEHADLERQIQEWEDRKAAERNRGSVLDGIVTSQPVLSLTQKLFERLAGAGFPRDAVSPSLTRVDIPFRKHARDSVEDAQRRQLLQLMDQVRAAETAAGLDGVVPRGENDWRKYLGMSYEEDTVEGQAESVDDDAVSLDVRAESLGGRAESRPDEDDDHEHLDPWSEDAKSNDSTAGPGSTDDTKADFDFEFDGESTDVFSFDFSLPKRGRGGHEAPESAHESEFPEPEDFPGPAPKHRVVDADPITAGEREVDLTYQVDVPRMVVRSEWDDEDD